MLFFREMGFPLSKIKEILNDPEYNRTEVLKLHRHQLFDRRRQLDQMIMSIDKTIRHTKGEISMTNKEKFEGFNFSHNPYENEAKKLWGDKTVDLANKKITSMAQDEQRNFSDQFNSIYFKLAGIRHLDPSSYEAQTGIKEWYDLLNTIDKFGDGLALFMRNAMAIFADRCN